MDCNSGEPLIRVQKDAKEECRRCKAYPSDLLISQAKGQRSTLPFVHAVRIGDFFFDTFFISSRAKVVTALYRFFDPDAFCLWIFLLGICVLNPNKAKKQRGVIQSSLFKKQ